MTDTQAIATELVLAALRGNPTRLMQILAVTPDHDIRLTAGQALQGLAEVLREAAPGQLPAIVDSLRQL